MTASNHFVTGAFVGASIANPWLAAPVAVASHFALDALPHFGFVDSHTRIKKRRRLFRSMLILDGLVLIALITYIVFNLNSSYLLIFSLLAYSPDFVWVYNFTAKESFGTLPPVKRGPISSFHANIQHLERPWGIFIEIPFFVTMTYLVINLV